VFLKIYIYLYFILLILLFYFILLLIIYLLLLLYIYSSILTVNLSQPFLKLMGQLKNALKRFRTVTNLITNSMTHTC
jgi:hypothetical protein